MDGWIKLHRKLLDCDIWISDDDEPFDRRSAWIDLLLLANHRDKNIIFDGKPLAVQRGQYVTSVRKLASRWMWGNQKTLKFLRLLEDLNMITKESDSRRTLLTIVNYEVYQSTENTDRTQIDTVSERKSTTNKKDKNDKNNKEDICKCICKMFNSICCSYPSIKSISEARKKAIKARLKQYSVDDFKTLFEKAEASSFLKGGNDRNWTATFDWLIKDSNMAKVLDGNYDARQKATAKKSAFCDIEQNDYDFEAIEKMLGN